jgi:hypothetical protein
MPMMLRFAESQRTKTGTVCAGTRIRNAPEESMTALSMALESAARATALPEWKIVVPVSTLLSEEVTPVDVAS